MRKEVTELRRSHIENRVDCIKTLQDLYDASQVYCKDRSKLREETFKTEDDIKKYTRELKCLEANFRKKDKLLTQYISSLKDKVEEIGRVSFWELNPSLITETEFEEKLKEELLKETRKLYFGEDLFEKENVIKQYFIQTQEREKKLQEFKIKEVKLRNELNLLEAKYSHACLNYKKLEEEIKLDKSKYEDTLYNRENIINTRVESRNKGLPGHLSKYSSEDFEKYLKLNKNLYKQILRNFTSTTFKLMSNTEKEKFIELVIDDHSIKKNKYFDLIGSLIDHDAIMLDAENDKDDIKRSLCKNDYQFQELEKKVIGLENEMDLLVSSKEDLKKKIEKTLKNQVLELHTDKKDLQVKYNVNYFLFKVKECSERVEGLENRLNKFVEEYEKNNLEYAELFDKLQEEDLIIKKELIELGYNAGFKLPDGVTSDDDNNINKNNFNNSITMSMSMKKRNSIVSNSNNNTLKATKRRVNTHAEDIESKSLVGKQQAIDFTHTLDKVNEEFNDMSRVENMNMAMDDIEILDSRIPKVEEEVVVSNEDPFFISSVEKIFKLIRGLKVYKQLGKSSKYFDMLNSINLPPEKAGYVLRELNINVRNEQIEIKKGKHLEHKIPFDKLKGMILSNQSRALIKYLKTGVKPSLFCIPQVENLIECRYVPVQIMLEKSSVDLILPNYETFVEFSEGYEELLKLKNKVKRIIRYLEKEGKI